ncbi:MAG TPA: histidine kinase dimerization/phosphoacceptor domain -containing protein [Bacteroidia bacterium]|nr:histidine kinase dimerization/phosphoacceptor domain -containing protein [Bacteroidia bacterium]
MRKAIIKTYRTKKDFGKEVAKDFPDSLFKIAFKITNNGMAILDKSYPIEVNDQFLGIIKRSKEDTLGKDLLRYVFKDDIPHAKEEIKRNREVIYEVRFIRGDGSLAYLELRGHPIVYKGKKCRMLIIRDITVKKINEKLFLNYLNVLEAFPEAICVHDSRGEVLYTNPAMNKLLAAKSSEQVKGKQVMEYVSPEFHPVLKDNKKKLRRLESTSTRLIAISTFKRKNVKVELSALPLNWGGEPVVLAVCHDISLEERVHKSEVERQVIEAVNKRLKWEISVHRKLENKLKEMVEEKEWLLKEVNHRVKNNLQIITSILNLQINQLQDRKLVPVMKEFQNRFYALSSIYSSLYQSENKEEIDISAYLKDLTNNLFISYSDPHKSISLTCETDRVFLEYNQAITCGLIVNELVANSIKYAFPVKGKGTINVSLRETGQNIRLEVADDGIGIKAKDKKHEGALGLQLVESLVHQLKDGKIERLKVKKGTAFLITFTSESPVKKEQQKNTKA